MRGAADKPELLAPAGTLAAFTAAVRAGADAVYIGAPQLNARNLARHFSQAEIAAMLDYGHARGVKVYLAMNSLMKEEEIPRVVELLALLEKLSVDALIIQDIGLARLVRQYFPNLRIHASTLLNAHNSPAVRQLAQVGFSRIVLAREMTLAEIKKVHAAHPVELEVFIHGALCFSYSGLCLFSSYCGGKSGLRGRCVQPCRRRYNWLGPGKGHASGYFFSMNDLDGLELIPQIVQAGVSSLKIEGRMRSSQYVSAVVKAYRIIIDQGTGRESMAQARKLLDRAMGRKSCSGYFRSAQSDEIISARHSGNIGIFLGKIKQVRGGWATLRLQAPLVPGDRLRLHNESSGERYSFTLKRLREGKTGAAGQTISLELPQPARPGDPLYKVDVKKNQKEGRGDITARDYEGKIKKLDIRSKSKKIIRRIGAVPGVADRRRKKKKGARLPLRLITTEPALLARLAARRPEKIILALNRANLKAFARLKKNRLISRLLVWSLPPVILEDEVDFYEKAIKRLLAGNYRDWQIGHLGQLQFFQDEGRVNLSGGHTLNVVNSSALKFLREAGLSSVMAAVENDRENLAMICARKQGIRVGMMVHGLVPLFTSRLDAAHFQYGRVFASPRGEKFVLRRQGNLTLALPRQPFSLLSRLEEVAACGVDYGVIDFSWQRLTNRELDAVFRRTDGRKTKQVETFNFFGKLS